MKEIRGDAKNIRNLLNGAKFSIDYYQREYRWEKKQITELLDDLAEKFLENHRPENERSEVETYSHYFLGSIIISDKEGNKFIIDGQQRITSLTLLLIFLYRELKDEEQKSQLSELVFSKKFGKRSFNLDVPDRTACMEALFTNTYFDEEGGPESVGNILKRFKDIEDNFPEEISNEALPYFTDWLIENVFLVEITAYSDSDAYTIFETMNDRGLSLTPTDMLKGYLLANITDINLRNETNSVWNKHISELKNLGKEEEADAIKAWLRSQYAISIRERKRDANPEDFDLIGTEFHRWVRDKEKDLGLIRDSNFAAFIKEDLAFYLTWFKKIWKASNDLTEGLEEIFYNAQSNFTLQYPLLLAPLVKSDNDEEVIRKLQIVSIYLDILLTRRLWNGRSIGYSTMQYAMFITMREIRGKSSSELAEMLYKRLVDEDEETFDLNKRFQLHGQNGKHVHRILARLTDYLETQSGRASHYEEYIKRGGKNGYEIEHIWADNHSRHLNEFPHPVDFSDYRNHIGGLLLLPKSFNASYGAKDYAEKLEHYYGQNLLAKSLHEKAYKNDPGFLRFIENTKIPFHSHREFKKKDLDERQELFLKLAKEIWKPVKLKQLNEK